MEEYSYVYTGGSLMQMVVKTTTTPAGGTATTVTETLNFTYDASGTPLSVKFNGTDYYYVANIQGYIMAILNTSGSAVVEYTYDAWGKFYSATGTLASTLGEANPLTYRGYVYDHEIGMFYLQSRYYAPDMGRFINADFLVSTGLGFIGCNMNSYCNNNPVNRVDYSGSLPVGFEYYLEDCPAATSVPNGQNQNKSFYSSTDVAAKAFASLYFHNTLSNGIEYGAVIYSKTFGGKTVYWLGTLQEGKDTKIRPDFEADPSLISRGWDVAGFVHSHPNGITFSEDDDAAHIYYGMKYGKASFRSYVVFSYYGKFKLVHGMLFGSDDGTYIYRIGSEYLYPFLKGAGDRGCTALTYNQMR